MITDAKPINWLATLKSGGRDAERLAEALLGQHSLRIPAELATLAQSVLHERHDRRKAEAREREERRAAGLDMLRDPETGEPIEIQGHAILFGHPSQPLDGNGGLREIIMPGALPRGYLSRLYLTLDHDHAQPLPGQLEVCVGPTALLFRLRCIPVTPLTQALMHGVGRVINGCSFTFHGAHGRIIDWSGEKVFAVDRIDRITELSISADAAFEDTTCWLSNAKPARPMARVHREMWASDIEGAEWITCIPRQPEAARAA